MKPIEFTEAGDPVFRSVRGLPETTIGSRLRSERKRMGLSQTAFAELGGVSRKAQHRYEQDERAPDVRYISRIAQAGADVLFVITGVRGLIVERAEEGLLLKAEPRRPRAPKQREGLRSLQPCVSDENRTSEEEEPSVPRVHQQGEMNTRGLPKPAELAKRLRAASSHRQTDEACPSPAQAASRQGRIGDET
jgi:transcriptional regulator with XRE-family HTH domain